MGNRRKKKLKTEILKGINISTPPPPIHVAMRLILLLLAIIVFNYTTYTDGFQVEDEHRERELMAAGTTTVVWEQWETEGPKPLPRKNMARCQENSGLACEVECSY